MIPNKTPKENSKHICTECGETCFKVTEVFNYTPTEIENAAAMLLTAKDKVLLYRSQPTTLCIRE